MEAKLLSIKRHDKHKHLWLLTSYVMLQFNGNRNVHTK